MILHKLALWTIILGAPLIPTGSITNGQLGNGIVTNAKIANSTIDLTAKVTNALPVLNGGTNATSASAAAHNLGLGTADSPSFTGLTVTTSPGLSASDTIAVTGTSTGNATPLTAYVNRITSLSSSPGYVELPTTPPLGTIIEVDDTMSTGYLQVYPGAAGTIQGQAAGTTQPMGGQTAIAFKYVSTNNWIGYPIPQGFLLSSVYLTRLAGLQLADPNYSGTTRLDFNSTALMLIPGSNASSLIIENRANGHVYQTFNSSAETVTFGYPATFSANTNVSAILEANYVQVDSGQLDLGHGAVPTAIVGVSGANNSMSFQDRAVGNNILGVGTVSGANNVQIGNAISGTVLLDSATDAITAAGTNQTNCTQLVNDKSNVTTVAAGTGVCLPLTSAGAHFVVHTSGANNLLIYANPTRGTLNGQASTAPITLSNAGGATPGSRVIDCYSTTACFSGASLPDTN